jgi:acyl-CoA synthetase (AMP-forming)/AMP-acid ligase II
MDIDEIDTQLIGFLNRSCRENNVTYFLYQHAQKTPDRWAMKWVTSQMRFRWNGQGPLMHEAITYRDMLDRISRLGQGLRKLDIQKGDRVMVFLPMSLDLYLVMFAVLRIGAIAVFLDSWARRDQLGFCAQTVEPKAIISIEEAFVLAEDVPALQQIPIKVVSGFHTQPYTADLDQLLQTREPCDIMAMEPQETALITFTTGSSGQPKGANRTHRFLAAQHRALQQTIPYMAGDCDLPVFPVFSLNNLAAGVATILPAIDLARPGESDGEVLAQQIIQEQVTCCTLSPSLFVKVAQWGKENRVTLSSLRRVVTGGAPISPQHIEAFYRITSQAEIMVLYGSTEVEPIAHVVVRTMSLASAEYAGVNVGKISSALAYKFIKIHRGLVSLDAGGWEAWEVADGKVGELIVSGEHVCPGYYHNPQADRATKIYDREGKVWHRTGDLGYLDAKRDLWIVGRVHNAIFRAGKYLYPVPVEMLLKRIPFVRQAAFLGMPDPQWGEAAWVVVSLQREPSDLQGSLSEIKDKLSQYAVVYDHIQIVKDIPMDPRHHSKVEYTRLRESLMRGR